MQLVKGGKGYENYAFRELFSLLNLEIPNELNVPCEEVSNQYYANMPTRAMPCLLLGKTGIDRPGRKSRFNVD